MPETFTPSFESEEPTGLTEPTKSSETVTPIKPNIKFDPEKKEIIILLEEGDTVVEKRHPFQEFMYSLRDEGVRVSTGEWLDLQTLLSVGEVQSLDELYVVSRAVLVKDVTNFPQFDTVFGRVFYGIEPPSKKEENEDDNYDEQEDTNNEKATDKESKEKEDEKGKETEDKDKKKTEEQKADKKPEQKEKENIDEVEEATSMTSEEKHGGNEATKDIKNSPNPADNGENPDNKGAEIGLAGSEGGGEGEGGKKKSKLGSKGSGNEGEDTKEPVDNNDETNGQNEHNDKKSGSGKGKRKEKTTDKEIISGGKGGYPSARKAVEERNFDSLEEDRTLGYEQFGRALSKLRTIVQETTGIRSRQLDAYATVKSISQHGGAPELLWKEEIEEKPKVVIMFDVGGSTDEFRPIVEKLFTASKDFLDEVEVYYFHNAIWGQVWLPKYGEWGKKNEYTPLEKILQKEPSTKVIIVGDAWMAENELWEDPMGSWATGPLPPYSEEMIGINCFKMVKEHFENSVWINPIPEKDHDSWDNSGTISAIKKVFPMYDLSLSGIEKAVKELMEEK